MTTQAGPGIISIGELLIDLISEDYADDFQSAETYRRIPGGSPANLAMNLGRLGQSVGLVATVGQDAAGTLLIDAVAAAGVRTEGIARVEEPTTLILVTKSKAVSQFSAYRAADAVISVGQLAAARLSEAAIVHTTAFALSREPARSNILEAMQRAAAAGARLSVDYNYADQIWRGDRAAGLAGLRRLAGAGALVKVSDVDFERLFDRPVADPAEAAAEVLALGATLVCLTLGEKGCFVLTADTAFHLPARPVDVVDTTGAGDAFWSGFLAAYAEGYDARTCALAGRGMAERKLTRVGPVTERLTVAELLV